MIRQKFLTLFFTIVISASCFAQYNNLWVPDTISGRNFNLTIKDTFAQLRPGQQTITGGINTKFWGPTLFFNQGDTVHMNVRNLLNDSTTLHWHGMHLPAVMDGGPHQVIPPGALWQPFWKVTNNAATYWYHPHLHEMTLDHLTKGIGGFIIVRDPQESALALPRNYGVDDIPLMLTSRRYDAANQFVVNNTAYGDYMLTNGTPNAQVSLPKQYVRLRLLNAEVERGYDLGFADNRTFYIIANDGGLLDAPVAVTRVKLLVGERIEIMVNLGNDAVGSSIDLKAFNSNQAFGFPGGEPATNGQFGSLLNNIDFTVLHINVAATTANPITNMPASLVSNVYWTAGQATVNRSLAITGGNPGTNIPFIFDNTPFALSVINKTVNLNAIESWTVTNNNVFGHTFHIHDVQFKIVARNGSAAAVGAHESGWKDVMYVPRSESVTFVAKFEDYADAVHPFMYHCHFSNHEDGGMMGQFVVTNGAVSPTIAALNCAATSFNSNAIVNVAYNGTATVPYIGGNAVAYNAGTAIASTGVTGLTATLQSGTLANGAGNLSFTISGTPTSIGVASFAISFGGQNCIVNLQVINSQPTIPAVLSLDCATVSYSATAVVNTPFNATANLPYTGGNGLAYPTGNPISSVGVTGLTAILQAGTLSNGNGNLVFNITGTPASVGVANFSINFGGRNCNLSLTINNNQPQFPTVTSINCAETLFGTPATLNSYYASTASVPYTGGNGAPYPFPGPLQASSGVIGLNAQLQPGTLSNGNGNFIFAITGTPTSTGFASFSINFAGQTCSFSLPVNNASTSFDYTIHPNPVKDILHLSFTPSNTVVYYVWIYDALGRTLMMLPQPDVSRGIDVSGLPKGTYFIRVMDAYFKQKLSKKFVKG